MKIEKYVVGMIGTNCYLVINEETKDTVMVDPGAYPAKLKNAVKEQGLKLKAVLLTHAHFDHIMGLSDVMEDIKVPVYVEEADLPMMMDGESNLSSGICAEDISSRMRFRSETDSSFKLQAFSSV